jgi:SPP1 family predicted phage head-tail adaptor
MRAGRLDRRVTLQQRTLAQDAQGQQIETWTDVDTVWASKRDLRGREFFAAEATNAEASTVFEIRYRADVTVLNRLVYAGVTHRIIQVAEIGRRQGLQLICAGKVP